MRKTIREVLCNIKDMDIIDIIPDKIKKKRNFYDIKYTFSKDRRRKIKGKGNSLL